MHVQDEDHARSVICQVPTSKGCRPHVDWGTGVAVPEKDVKDDFTASDMRIQGCNLRENAIVHVSFVLDMY